MSERGNVHLIYFFFFRFLFRQLDFELSNSDVCACLSFSFPVLPFALSWISWSIQSVAMCCVWSCRLSTSQHVRRPHPLPNFLTSQQRSTIPPTREMVCAAVAAVPCPLLASMFLEDDDAIAVLPELLVSKIKRVVTTTTNNKNCYTRKVF